MNHDQLQRDPAGLVRRLVSAVPVVFGLAFLGLALGLLVAEAVAVFVLPAPMAERWPPSMAVPDADLGYRMMPHDVHYTYTHRVEINAEGLRNPSIGPKQPGEFRVLALGDSEVYGQGLADEAVFTTRLQAALNRTPRRESAQRFTVINTGVRAYATDQEIAFLRKTGLALQPDLVLLCVYVNDFETTDVRRTYLRLAHINDGQPYLFDLRMPSGVEARLLWEGVQLLRRSRVLMFTHDVIAARYEADGYEMRLTAGVVDDEIRRRVADFERVLETFRDVLSTHRVDGVVVIIPAPEQVRNPALPPRYQELVTAAARQAGLSPVIDLLPAFRERFPDHAPILPYDPHYDASAHALIAEVLEEVVAERAAGADCRGAGKSGQ